MAERDSRLNQQKSNRFLPWRNSRDEIGTDPVNPGDLCLFLDPDTHEWVLEEFMSDWWFDKSWRFTGMANVVFTEETRQKQSQAHKGHRPGAETRAKIVAANTGTKHTAETKAKISTAHKGKKLSADHRAKIGAIHKGKKVSAETKAKMSAAHKKYHEKRRGFT
jgi:hypothetical protein